MELEGMYTHFAVADSNMVYTESQLAKFNEVIKYAKKLGLKFIAHAANTAAIKAARIPANKELNLFIIFLLPGIHLPEPDAFHHERPEGLLLR